MAINQVAAEWREFLSQPVNTPTGGVEHLNPVPIRVVARLAARGDLGRPLFGQGAGVSIGFTDFEVCVTGQVYNLN